jgi:hypothetical protein
MHENSGISRHEWKLLITGKKDIKKIGKDRLSRAVISGIPSKYRGEIWCLLCSADEESTRHDAHIYHKLLEMNNEEEEYNITKDINRTFPELNKFKEEISSGRN